MKNFIKKKLHEGLEYYSADNATNDQYKLGVEESEDFFRFNDDGRFNKSGYNVIYRNNEEILSFQVSQAGAVVHEKTNVTMPNAILIPNLVSPIEGQGNPQLGFEQIFKKLPKIENILVDCYEKIKPYWVKLGFEPVGSYKTRNGNVYLMNLKRS